MIRQMMLPVGVAVAALAGATVVLFLVRPELAPGTAQPISRPPRESQPVRAAQGQPGGAASGQGAPLQRFQVEKIAGRPEAPNFSLPTPEGRTLQLAHLRGRVIALNFWATWCVPCRTEMPAMDRLYRKYQAQALTVLGVNYQEPAKRVRAFMQELKLTFPTIIDPLGEVYEAYRIFALPTTYLIGREGRLEGKIVGYRDWAGAEAEQAVTELLERGQPTGSAQGR